MQDEIRNETENKMLILFQENHFRNQPDTVLPKELYNK